MITIHFFYRSEVSEADHICLFYRKKDHMYSCSLNFTRRGYGFFHLMLYCF